MRFLAATAIALMALPDCAQAQAIAEKTFPPNVTVLPPLEYDRPYRGQMFVIRGNAEQMAAACPKTINPITLGCAVKLQEGKGCVIFVANDGILAKTDWNYHVIYRHERGHCGGMGGDHRGLKT